MPNIRSSYDHWCNLDWTPTTWKNYPIKQPPNYPNEDDANKATDALSKYSPLVFAGEVRTLQEELAKVSLGQGFLLMGGDCAESFKEFSVNHIRDTLRIILQMSLVLTFGASLPGMHTSSYMRIYFLYLSFHVETHDGRQTCTYNLSTSSNKHLTV